MGSWLDIPKSNDLFYIQNQRKIDDLKRYLGYPPYNTSQNIQKRCPKYAKFIENKYGKTIQELLNQLGMKDFGATPEPQNTPTTIIPNAELMKSYKAIYEVSDLYFWRSAYVDHIWCCSLDPKFAETEQIMPHNELKLFLEVISGEKSIRAKTVKFNVELRETGTIHHTLDSLREEVFIIKLAKIDF